ncbi:GntR family transcriptional regulator [Cupriavidus basilensis]
MESAPLYRQLAQHYLHAIETGALKPGDRIPSVRTLMELHGVSLSTALQACRQMESDGLLEARPRSGYFVRHTRQQAAGADRGTRRHAAGPRAVRRHP